MHILVVWHQLSVAERPSAPSPSGRGESNAFGIMHMRTDPHYLDLVFQRFTPALSQAICLVLSVRIPGANWFAVAFLVASALFGR
jgi:hypothetical protein